MVQSCKGLLFPHLISALIQSNMKENIFTLLTISTPLVPNWVQRSKERISPPSVVTKLIGVQSGETYKPQEPKSLSFKWPSRKVFLCFVTEKLYDHLLLTAVSELTFCKPSLNGSTPVLYFMRTYPIYCFNYSYHIKYYIITLIMTKIMVG